MKSACRWGMLLLSLLPIACAVDPLESDGKPAVVATTSTICDLTRQSAAEAIALTCLLAPGQDPHTYEPTPRDRAAIDDADLILYGGYNFAPDIEQLIAASTNSSPKVSIYEVAVPNPLVGEVHDLASTHEGEHSREEHLEGNQFVPDPHVWHSASNGAAIGEAIGEQLTEIAPSQAELISRKQAELMNELGELHEWIARQVATVPEDDRISIATHQSFGYFAEAYGFEVAGSLSGIDPKEAASAGRMAELIDRVEEAGVKAIFAETTTQRDFIEAVARDAGAIVPEQALYVEGPGGEGTPAATYQLMLKVNTCAIVEGLGGECRD